MYACYIIIKMHLLYFYSWKSEFQSSPACGSQIISSRKSGEAVCKRAAESYQLVVYGGVRYLCILNACQQAGEATNHYHQLLLIPLHYNTIISQSALHKPAWLYVGLSLPHYSIHILFYNTAEHTYMYKRVSTCCQVPKSLNQIANWSSQLLINVTAAYVCARLRICTDWPGHRSFPPAHCFTFSPTTAPTKKYTAYH